MQLPGELWEEVLARSGPLALAVDVGADARRIAAVRLQRWARHRPRPKPLRIGARVAVFHAGRLRIGYVVGASAVGTPAVGTPAVHLAASGPHRHLVWIHNSTRCYQLDSGGR